MASRILIPCDVSNEDGEWLQSVVDEAVHNLAPSGHLLFITVVPKNLLNTAKSKLLEVEFVVLAKKKLLSIVAKTVPANINAHIEVKRGGISSEIVSAAQAWPADLIVMASSDPSMKSRLLGSNASQVVTQAPCSVLVVRHAKEDAESSGHKDVEHGTAAKS